MDGPKNLCEGNPISNARRLDGSRWEIKCEFLELLFLPVSVLSRDTAGIARKRTTAAIASEPGEDWRQKELSEEKDECRRSWLSLSIVRSGTALNVVVHEADICQSVFQFHQLL